MNCTEFEALLDESFSPDGYAMNSALADHAAACPTCRMAHERARLLSEALVAWRDQPCEVDLTTAVLAGAVTGTAHGTMANTLPTPVGDDQQQEFSHGAATVSRVGTELRPLAAAGLPGSRQALCLATAVVLATFTLLTLPASSRRSAPIPRDFSSTTTEPAPAVESAVATAEAGPNDTPALPSTEPAPRPYSDLVKLATTAWDEVSMLVSPETRSADGAVAPPVNPPASGWMNDLQHRLKPVGRSLDHTLDFLWQAGRATDG
ncbi:MAG: hypothetical protein JSS02_21915 [Planctomycetes bacterium]|nr:hypothetical protein [Planctomycetota bacterium]